MKSILKTLGMSALTAVIIFSMATCDLEKDDDTDGPTNYTGAFKINKEQVWEGTTSNKLSEVYKKFDGERGISINDYWTEGDGKYNPTKVLGEGIIEKGRLSCDIPVPVEDDLMDWDNFKFEFSEWKDIKCVPKVKGTYLRLVTSENEWLNREKISGSDDSVWLESIWFLYVDNDCHITGTPSDGTRPGDAFFKTSDLDLILKKGWNTICLKQLLKGNYGIEMDTMQIKNPNDFKWVLRTVHPKY